MILSSAGRNQSFFTSELTLTNRGEREARLDYSYTAHIGGGSGRASEVLAPGRQKIETDALGYLTEPGDSDSRNGQPDRDAAGGGAAGVGGGGGGADDHGGG